MEDDLTAELLVGAYRVGVFPMADESGEIHWFSPDPRSVFEYDRFRVTRSLRQTIRRATFEIRIDAAFDEVVNACAEREEGTWISQKIKSVYGELHATGHAHSVETWQKDQLVGGLYGVAIGGAFFGESMFHTARDASKVALVALIERLQQRGYTLIDTQWCTPHLERFGAHEIPRDDYLQRLAAAIDLPVTFAD